MIRSSSVRALSYSSRAAVPYCGWFEDRRKAPLQLPRGEEKRPVDERHELGQRHLVEHAPADEGRLGQRLVRPVDPQAVLRRAPRRARAAVRGARCAARATDPGARGWRARTRAAASSLSRLETTSTTRDASSTWTVVWPYSGATFTAVCCLLVVAPPMRSGRRMCRRSISLATNTISSSDGVMRPAQARRCRPFSSIAVCRILVARHHHAEVDHLVAVAAEHDADDVLADVVDVAFHRREDDLALATPSRRRRRPPSAPRARPP